MDQVKTGVRPRSQELQPEVSVLLVDDNSVNREVTVEMLESMGYRVRTVCTGREAVDAMVNRTFALVLMDCQMSEMDGFAATAAIREREKDQGLSRIPIIALTAHAIAGDRERCLAQGMDDYLSKPFRQSQLAAVVQRWAPQHGKFPARQPESLSPTASDTPIPTDATNCLDERTLRDLRSLRRPGRADIYAEILEKYIDSSERYIEAMRQHIATRSATELSQAAHSFKSSSGMVGARTLAEYVKQLEAIGLTGDFSSAPAVLLQIEMEYGRVCQAVKGLLAQDAA